MIDPITVIEGDCLQEMANIPAGSVDCVMTDPPWGTTYAPWDCDVPMPDLWLAWKRVLRPGGAIVIHTGQPFTAAVLMSNPKQFRIEWIWDKVNGANFANSKRQPLKTHEQVLVFCDRQPTYNPQKVPGKANHKQGSAMASRQCATQKITDRAKDDLSGLKFPKSIQTFPKHSSQSGLHPTQKPIDLMRYLIRTHTNPGELILDCFAGSGSTLVAAMMESRRAIGIEQRPDYAATARNRVLGEVQTQLTA